MKRVLFVLSSAYLVGSVLSEQEAPSQAASVDDDECAGRDGCALNALQFKTSVVRVAVEDFGSAPLDPDFEFRDDNEEPELGQSLAELEAHVGVDGPEDDDDEAEDDFYDEMADEDDWPDEDTTPVEDSADDADAVDEDEEADEGDMDDYYDQMADDDIEDEVVTTTQPPLPEGAFCHNGTSSCSLGQECIVKNDKTFSQCMNCDKVTFQKQCQKLDEFMRYSYVNTCKLTCMDSKCYNDDWCVKPYKCAVDKTHQWGQCVACHDDKQWHAACHGWSDELRSSAGKFCHHKKCSWGPVKEKGRRRRHR